MAKKGEEGEVEGYDDNGGGDGDGSYGGGGGEDNDDGNYQGWGCNDDGDVDDNGNGGASAGGVLRTTAVSSSTNMSSSGKVVASVSSWVESSSWRHGVSRGERTNVPTQDPIHFYVVDHKYCKCSFWSFCAYAFWESTKNTHVLLLSLTSLSTQHRQLPSS